MTSTDLVVASTQIGLPSQTIQRLRDVEAVVASGSASDLVDALVYTDAVLTVAREKRAADVSREAARIRILAIRRLGQILRSASEDEQERIWQVMPGRFGRCEELAEVPERLFKRVVADMIASDSPCNIAGVIRRAERDSLKPVEPGILIAFNGNYWTKDRTKAPGSAHTKNIETARRRLGLKASPHAVRLDEAFSQARMHASTLAQLGEKLPREARALVGDAELAQMRVAELLDRALRTLTGVKESA